MPASGLAKVGVATFAEEMKRRTRGPAHARESNRQDKDFSGYISPETHGWILEPDARRHKLLRIS